MVILSKAKFLGGPDWKNKIFHMVLKRFYLCKIMYYFRFPFGEITDLLNLPTGHVCGLRSHYLDLGETIVEFYVLSYTALSKGQIRSDQSLSHVQLFATP